MNKASKCTAILFLSLCLHSTLGWAKIQEHTVPTIQTIAGVNAESTYPSLTAISIDIIAETLAGIIDANKPFRKGPHQELYQIYSPNKNFSLQLIFDWINFHLAKTSLGGAIITQLLHCQENLIEIHLGVSPSAAHQITEQSCDPLSSHPFITDTDDWTAYALARKNGTIASQTPRSFLILNTLNKISFSSWTYPNSNITGIIINSSEDKASLVALLFQVLAHEMMIHFDSKAWLTSNNLLPAPMDFIFRQFFVKKADILSVQTVFSNPLLSTVLSFMRAFVGEKSMIDELVAHQTIKLNVDQEYSDDKYPFLSSNCDWNCLSEYIVKEINDLTPLALPLVSLSPDYRFLKYRALTSQNNSSETNPIEKEYFNNALNSLTSFPAEYLFQLSQQPYPEQIFYFINTPHKPDDKWQTVSQIFKKFFIPTELSWLFTAQSTGGNKKLINESIIPKLSLYTSGINSGPRPVIRGGAY